MDIEEFRRHGHAIVDWLAEYHERLPSQPVQASTVPGEVKAAMPAAAPQRPERFDACIDDLRRLVVPHISHWQHPSFFGYFPANAMFAGVLGDLVSTGLGVLGISWQSSPALTEIEEVTVDWFRQMLGLSDSWFGTINDTASSSTLVAMLCAREQSTSFSLARGGLQSEPSRHIVYASASSHSSVAKAALLAGFGKDNIRLVPLDEEQRMLPSALSSLIAQDVAAGLRPCCVVACFGATATNSIDSIREIAQIAKDHDLWLHVDAAMAGAAMILPELRWMWDGIESADSVVVNAHKWIGAPFDCSLYFVRDEQHLNRVMSTNPSYLQSSFDDQVRNLRDTGIPLGRRFRALKLWFLIREQGVEGLQARLRRDIENAERFSRLVCSEPGWRLVAPPSLQTVCIVHEPDGFPAALLDDYTRRWADNINRSGRAYLTPAQLDGRWMVRVSIGTPSTEWEHVEALWETIRDISTKSLQDFTI